MKKITKVQTERSFDAAHFLPNYSGKCQYIHGHRWTVKVDVFAPVDLETGMIIDFGKIKEIIDTYDHDFLNQPQRGQTPILNPTAENLAGIFADKIAAVLIEQENDFTQIVVKVYESPVSFAEVTLDNEIV